MILMARWIINDHKILKFDEVIWIAKMSIIVSLLLIEKTELVQHCICRCRNGTEDTTNFFLHCPLFSTIRVQLVNHVNTILGLHNVIHLDLAIRSSISESSRQQKNSN